MSVPESLRDMVEELTQDLTLIIDLVDARPPRNSDGYGCSARSDSC